MCHFQPAIMNPNLSRQGSDSRHQYSDQIMRAAIAALACGVIAAVATLADDDPRQPPCRDDPSFVDVGGFPCSAWRRFDCAVDTLAYSDGSYTAEGMRDVRQHCPVSCGLCFDERSKAQIRRRVRSVVEAPRDVDAHASLAAALRPLFAVQPRARWLRQNSSGDVFVTPLGKRIGRAIRASAGLTRHLCNNCLRRCVEASGFTFHPRNRARDKLYDWVLQSTVQSIRYDGPSGIPLRCDWVVGTRMSHWRKIPPTTAYGDITIQPRIVFVQTARQSIAAYFFVY